MELERQKALHWQEMAREDYEQLKKKRFEQVRRADACKGIAGTYRIHL